jgi:CMP-N-acetylneuraminic acid synthetase
LIEFTFEAARDATKLSQTVLSTDDPEIAELGRRFGIEVPFMRPDALAADDTATIDVLVHLCRWMESKGRNFDAICLLQPTSPDRSGKLIDECILRFEASDSDALVTVTEVPTKYNPMWTYWLDDTGELLPTTGGGVPVPRRQLLRHAYVRDGRIYLTRTRVILEQNSLYGNKVVGYPLDPGFNIDSPEDLEAFRRFVADSQSNA